jgi:DNA-directed RNA polymerase specialized sigma24 family protein
VSARSVASGNGRALPRIVPFDSRERIARALFHCTRPERAVLALLLIERLTPVEAADALGITAGEVERVYHDLMRDLDQTLETGARKSRRPRLGDDPVELRKAS